MTTTTTTAERGGKNWGDDWVDRGVEGASTQQSTI
jgi:hypothetical protein